MKTWIIHFGNLHFCGGEEYILVEAETEEDAEDYASGYMQEYQYELFRDEFDDEEDQSDEPSYSVISVELFDENHEYYDFRNTIKSL
jgi:hypothetical protein